MISHKHKFIFIHIPKTGGTSIERLFDPNAIPTKDASGGTGNTCSKHKHWKTSDYETNYPELFDSYFKFMFIRNPWDRLVSRYEWQKFVLPESHIHFKTIEQRTFKQFIKQRVSAIFDKWCYCDLVCDKNGKRVVDFVGRFENLQNDFDIVCDKIGTPRQQLPSTNHLKRKNYIEYYDNETREIVAQLFQRDIEYFGYQFGE
jgi:hypothetical protein